MSATCGRSYVTASSIDGLRDAASGRAAIVVSGGPSLDRNIRDVRRAKERGAVVIAATRALRPLAAVGTSPHLAVAIDWSPRSAAHIEGLATDDIVLVADTRASTTLTDAWRGPVVYTGDPILDAVTGSSPRATLPTGGTVTCLAHALARWLGCNPVVHVGLDLCVPRVAGRYRLHARGADIPGDTLPGTVSHTRDVRGRAVAVNVQMVAYRHQLEAMCARDAAAGLAVIDATEGGVRKRHARTCRLREALAELPRHRPWRVPHLPAPAPRDVARAARRIRRTISELRRLADLADQTRDALRHGRMRTARALTRQARRLRGAMHLALAHGRVPMLERLRLDHACRARGFPRALVARRARADVRGIAASARALVAALAP